MASIDSVAVQNARLKD